MTGSRSTTYRATGGGGVVSSRSAAWQELAESSDPAVRAAARVVNLRPADEGAAARSAAALPPAERSAGPTGQADPEPPAPAGR
ncbi:MAG: hypothetical protein U0Q15_16620 [Kineosporiaceae bacterium]